MIPKAVIVRAAPTERLAAPMVASDKVVRDDIVNNKADIDNACPATIEKFCPLFMAILVPALYVNVVPVLTFLSNCTIVFDLRQVSAYSVCVNFKFCALLPSCSLIKDTAASLSCNKCPPGVFNT